MLGNRFLPHTRRAFSAAAIGLVVTAVSGCATPTASNPELAHWSGRLSMRVEADDSVAPQSIAVLFELQGSQQQGELTLETPLGNRVALLTWNDSEALLVTGDGQQRAESVQGLLQSATGTPIPPLGALFDWLHGTNTSVPGWTIDLSRRSEGLISATRTSPRPQAFLRIALSR